MKGEETHGRIKRGNENKNENEKQIIQRKYKEIYNSKKPEQKVKMKITEWLEIGHT